MFYKNELEFLKSSIEKLRVRFSLVDMKSSPDSYNSLGLAHLTKANDRFFPSLYDRFCTAEKNTVYKISDLFSAEIIFFVLPSETKLVVIGPFLCEPYSEESFLEKAESHRLSHPDLLKLEKYYQGLPIVSNDSHIYAMLETFCELIYGGGENYSVVRSESDIPDFPFKSSGESDDVSPLDNMAIMEERYRYEDALMSSISKGLTNRADFFLSNFSPTAFEKRLSDPLRNAKNYAIIMNTLCRKAAQEGGVHPVYLDRLSSDFARRIEGVPKIDDIEALMTQMYRSYCRLVKKYSAKNYSPPVVKAIMCIESDLSADLSLKTLAKMQNLSAGYLSSLFSKEVGSTVTDYVNTRRIKLAKHLLSTTALQVQTIAQHCGFTDLHYFSRVFKKITGLTPLAFRKNNN